MPKISFCFQGHINGVEVTKASDVEGKQVDVSNMDADKLCRKLNDGELFISLGDYLYKNNNEEIELYDFGKTDQL